MQMKFAIPALILAAGLIGATASYGKVEYTKKEKKGCVFCHVSAKSKELNDAGKYYQDKKTLKGYKAPQK